MVDVQGLARSRFVVIGAMVAMSACADVTSPEEVAVAPRAPGEGRITRLEAVATGHVVPVLASDPGGRAPATARVELPIRASGSVRIEDRGSSMALTLVLRSAADVPIELSRGLALYRRALADGADMIHRVRDDGTEDFVAFARKPEREEMVYDVDVSRAAGLRLVANTLELLDARGAPRLRVAPPSVQDASGERFPATLSITGCDVDTSPAPPWDRPVTAPCGAQTTACRCDVHVRWSDAHVRYPALVDPAWTTTTSLASARTSHAAGLLPNGQAFVVGGRIGGSMYLASMELYDRTTETWSAGADLTSARARATATRLDDGRFLLVGGRDLNNTLATAEIYDPAKATWTLTTPLATAREFHTATLTPGGVLVVGGLGDVALDSATLYTAELYNPATATWSSAGKLAGSRAYHAAAALNDARQRVLITGGRNSTKPPTFLGTAEVYDPVLKKWTTVAPMSVGRALLTATTLDSGRVLAAGGSIGTGGEVTAAVEIYDSSSDTWMPGPSLATGRSWHSATTLLDGRVLVTGGTDINDALTSAEVLTADTLAWLPAGVMAHAAREQTAVRLPTNELLIAGGLASSESIGFVELFRELAAKEPCTGGGECLSGLCSARVCCDQACDATCLACTAVEKGGGVDGVCGMKAGNPCKEYACDPAGTCKTICTGPDDCTTGNTCVGGACVPAGDYHCDGDHIILVNDGSMHNCGLIRCSTITNACLLSCAGTSANCITRASCADGDKCMLDAAPPPAPVGCACALGPRSATDGERPIGIAVLTLMLAAAWRERHRRMANTGGRA